jgi:hypothetical protein
MPIFYFQRHVNGRRSANNRRGRQFDSEADARVHASYSTPRLLRKNLSSEKDTFVSTEVSDGKRTLYIVRGKVTSEKQ